MTFARVLLSALVGIGLLGGEARAQGSAPVAFDRFLSGFAEGCRHGPDYRRFAQGVLRRDARRGWTLANADAVPPGIAPAEIARSFGRPELVRREGVVIVTIPVSGGTYRGFEVRALRLMRGIEEPTVGDAIVFAVPRPALERGLAQMLASSRARLGDIQELDLTEEDGPVRLECFAAN